MKFPVSTCRLIGLTNTDLINHILKITVQRDNKHITARRILNTPILDTLAILQPNKQKNIEARVRAYCVSINVFKHICTNTQHLYLIHWYFSQHTINTFNQIGYNNKPIIAYLTAPNMANVMLTLIKKMTQYVQSLNYSFTKASINTKIRVSLNEQVYYVTSDPEIQDVNLPHQCSQLLFDIAKQALITMPDRLLIIIEAFTIEQLIDFHSKNSNVWTGICYAQTHASAVYFLMNYHHLLQDLDLIDVFANTLKYIPDFYDQVPEIIDPTPKIFTRKRIWHFFETSKDTIIEESDERKRLCFESDALSLTWL